MTIDKEGSMAEKVLHIKGTLVQIQQNTSHSF